VKHITSQSSSPAKGAGLDAAKSAAPLISNVKFQRCIMGKSAIVAGTGFEGRALIIQRHCEEGKEVILKREPNNKHDENAIAVYFQVPRLFGLLGTAEKQIGYIKANTAKSLAKKMDSGKQVKGHVKSFYSPEGREHPRVTLELEY